MSGILLLVNKKDGREMTQNLSLLIIDADEDYARGLRDCAREHELFLSAEYVLNGKDGFELTRIINPDVVIIDFLVPKLDAIGYLRLLNSSNIKKKPVVIINSLTMLSAMLTAASEQGADYFMIKPQPYGEVLNTVLDLSGTKKAPAALQTGRPTDELDIQITRFLHCMGVPAHLSGYNYIRSSIKLAISDINVLTPITRRLYPELARKYNTTSSCVERAIRHAIKVSWDRGNKKVITDIFGYSPDTPYTGCPTNSEYLAMAADDLKLRIKHNMAI